MESFDKSLFQANLEVYNFKNKLYKKIRHVCTYPTERTDNKNHCNYTIRKIGKRSTRALWGTVDHLLMVPDEDQLTVRLANGLT